MPAHALIVALSCPSCGAKGQARAIVQEDGVLVSIAALSRQFRLRRIDYTLEDTRFGCPDCKIPVKAVIDGREACACKATAAPCQ